MSEDKPTEKETEVKKAEEPKAEEVKVEEKKTEVKGADDTMSVEERKAAKLESDKKDANKYFYPNKWARIVLTSVTLVVSSKTL